MKRGRLGLLLTTSLGGLFFALSPGCQDPTQVTIEVTLEQRLTCAEVKPGTVLHVGATSQQVEEDLLAGVSQTKTNRCDDARKEIGSIVVVPGDSPGGAVTIVVGYERDPTTCRPPLYEGCIVARRRFTFVEHTPLRIPIEIDADCKAVPCDAFSTCSRGKCFDSDVRCREGRCTEPGELPDGAADDDAAVTPDAPQPGNPDAASDGALNLDGGSGRPRCMGFELHCPTLSGPVAPCAGACCGPLADPEAPICQAANDPCPGKSFCCSDANCRAGTFCESAPLSTFGLPFAPPAPGELGTCVTPPAQCSTSNTLLCPLAPCTGAPACCVANVVPPAAGTCAAACNGLETRVCCTDADCDGSPCVGGGANNRAGTCAGVGL